jgi:hypothetical protein
VHRAEGRSQAWSVAMSLAHFRSSPITGNLVHDRLFLSCANSGPEAAQRSPSRFCRKRLGQPMRTSVSSGSGIANSYIPQGLSSGREGRNRRRQMHVPAPRDGVPQSGSVQLGSLSAVEDPGSFSNFDGNASHWSWTKPCASSVSPRDSNCASGMTHPSPEHPVYATGLTLMPPSIGFSVRN